MKKSAANKKLSLRQRGELFGVLKARFDEHMHRHQGIEWTMVKTKLGGNSSKLWSLNEMADSGGEPDVMGYDPKTDECIFFDCSAESPKGRVAVCYDREGLESRKEHNHRLLIH